MSQHDLFRYDPDIGYTFTPDTRARVPFGAGAYLVSTNELGFRSDPLPADTAGDVLVFGDSFTAGDGVSNGKRWTDLLAGSLGGARVHNFGLPGSGTDQQYLAWRKFAADRACACVLVAVLVENVRRVTSAWRPTESKDGRVMFRAKPYFTLEDGALEPHHQPVPTEAVAAEDLDGGKYSGGRFTALRNLAIRFGVKDLVQQMTSYQPVPDYDSPDSDGWRLMSAILERWSAECRTPMVIVPLPIYQHVEGTADAAPYLARFRELGKRTGRPILDVLPALQRHGRAERRQFRFGDDPHPTIQGHQALADAIAPALAPILDS